MAKHYFCERCKKTLSAESFYTSYNTEKYTDGKLNQCKSCITAHVNNWQPETYLWILQELDVPYVPDEWNKLMLTYAGPGKKVTGTTIIGRYISKMRLQQYKNFRWKDSEFVQKLAASKIEQTMRRQGYDEQQIAETISKGAVALPPEPAPEPIEVAEEDNYFQSSSPDSEAFSDQLTDEDKKYLRLKWGKGYKPEEWIALEQLYTEMTDSYDIQSAGHVDTLKLVCKTSLKCNQLIDIGDVEGFQKMSRVYDQLMRSGKFKLVDYEKPFQFATGVLKAFAFKANGEV